MEQARMSIGVAARMTGINANTLRMWERRYQLGPSKRGSGGQREYSTMDIDHLRLIKKLMNKGVRIGDIAQLSTKTLTSLLLDSGDHSISDVNLAEPIKTQVVGTTLSNYFKAHMKRYPKLAIQCSDTRTEEWMHNPELHQKDLLILQQSSLNGKHIEPLINIGKKKVHIIVLYLYCNQETIEKLEHEGLILIQGDILSSRIDEAVNKALRLISNVSELDKSSQAFDISLPKSQPRHFDESDLIAAEAQSSKLNCECPQHLSNLIRQLSAFEEYSKTCEAENWKQAAVHACIYSYANQARYLIEKALQAALDE
jgi:DNA-binding transcriptional MerR regulator